MQTITLETRIAAPVERCFLLSLSIDLHQETASATGERAIAGVTSGILGPGETVTFRGRHFGLWLTHKTRITGYSRPDWFQDSMEQGIFRLFVHDHFFFSDSSGTLMRDHLRFAAPLAVLGWFAERALLRRYLTGFLTERNRELKSIAESVDGNWRRFVPGSVWSR